jgi:hypothetical protein
MNGWATTNVSTSSVGVRVLGALAVLALAIGLAALPAGALAVPVAPVATPTIPRAPVEVPVEVAPHAAPVALPTPNVSKPPLPKPALPPLPLPGSAALPGPGSVPTLLAPIHGTVGAVTRTVAAPARVASSVAPVRAARSRLTALPRGLSTTASRSVQSDQPVPPGDSIVRSPNHGNEVRVVPASVCSSQVAFAVPAAPQICTNVTPAVAAELGLPASSDGSSVAGVPGLALTGASILGLVLIGALALALGGATRPFRRYEQPLVAPQDGQAWQEPARCMMSPQT